MNDLLNNKWWIPREEKLGNSASTRRTLKDVLIYIKYNYEQLPGGCVDLKDVTNILTIEQQWDKGLGELEEIAIFFDKRIDEDTGEINMFFDVKAFKDLPNGASSVTTESIGLHMGILVETNSTEIYHKNDCRQLCEEAYGSGVWEHENDTIYSEYSDSWILSDDASHVESNEQCFHHDCQPSGVYWSDYNESYVDADDDYVNHGYINGNGNEGYFYDEDYVYCEDNDTYYANSNVAYEVDNVTWSDERGEYTNRNSSLNAGYRELPRIMKLTPSTEFGIGFEIEKEDCDAEGIQWEPLYKKTGWAKEDDSSLDAGGGYELVSPAFDLHTKDLDEAIEESDDLKTLINADFTTNCGGHLTVSSSLYSANEMLEGLSAFFPLLYALYNGRTENDYSRPKLKWEYHSDRGRGAINSRGNRSITEADHKTFGAIEMRIFSAVISVKNLMWRRDLVKIMVENFGKSEGEILRLLINPKSKLFKHLLKVYNVQRIVNKISLYVSMSKEYNHKVLQMPDHTELLEKFRNQLNKNNDSTNELGA